MKSPMKNMHESQIRHEEDIHAEIWDRLYREDTVRLLDINHIHVEVDKSSVILSGHVAKSFHQGRIPEIVQGIPGIKSIRNELIADRELEIDVAQAIDRNPMTRGFEIFTHSSHGWIHLQGEVPTPTDSAAVEEIASSVQGVRGVVTLPQVAGEPSSPTPRIVQPRLNAKVYTDDGQAGRVSQVVISPRSRLVTHIVVEARLEKSGHPVMKELVIPVESIRRSTGSSVFLSASLQETLDCPLFDPEEYPLAPKSWRPPFPYVAGEVCWSHQLASIPWVTVVGVPMPVEVIHRDD